MKKSIRILALALALLTVVTVLAFLRQQAVRRV